LLFVFFASSCFAQSKFTKLEWALQYKGTLKNDVANGKATSQIIQTFINNQDGVRFQVEGLIGNTANFYSENTEIGTSGFTAMGNISFGTINIKNHALNFVTIESGYLLPSPVANHIHGLALYNITGGMGVFEGALGYITSNFVINKNDGSYIDDQFAIAWVQQQQE